ncbi:hypothetical protein BC829DRAFT_393501 [Chytridium lagenaria]|nr:hypothetical protein BC829DRAFT_393501 [Chytridium lagenaria]
MVLDKKNLALLEVLLDSENIAKNTALFAFAIILTAIVIANLITIVIYGTNNHNTTTSTASVRSDSQNTITSQILDIFTIKPMGFADYVVFVVLVFLAWYFLPTGAFTLPVPSIHFLGSITTITSAIVNIAKFIAISILMVLIAACLMPFLDRPSTQRRASLNHFDLQSFSRWFDVLAAMYLVVSIFRDFVFAEDVTASLSLASRLHKHGSVGFWEENYRVL